MNMECEMLANRLTAAELEMCHKYYALKEEFKTEIHAEFMNNGMSFCCNNPSGEILLTGINPSGNDTAVRDYTFKEAKDCGRSHYWKDKKEQITGTGALIDHVAYLDLFPYIESSQKKFMKEIRPHITFQVKALEITQRKIEEYIKPRLIIAANKSSAFYWGYGKFTWMGYNFVEVLDRPDCLKNKEIRLFQINPQNGFRGENDRINQDKYTESKIKGAYFIPYAMYDTNEKGRNHYPERMLTPDLVMELYQWVRKQ